MLSYNDIGAGIPIVFIHGLGSRKEAWERQHELACKYRLIIPDLRGHGDTELSDGITVGNFAKDVIKLLEHLDIESAFICGLSLGGIVAQEIYKQKPSVVRGLILANTTSYIPYLLGHMVARQNELAFKRGTIIDEVVKRGLYDKSYAEEAKNAFKIRDTYIESSKSAIGINYFPYLSNIEVPVLLIGGSHDRVTPSFNVGMMSVYIKDCESVIFEKTGHLSNIESSEKFNKAVDEFINKNR